MSFASNWIYAQDFAWQCYWVNCCDLQTTELDRCVAIIAQGYNQWYDTYIAREFDSNADARLTSKKFTCARMPNEIIWLPHPPNYKVQSMHSHSSRERPEAPDGKTHESCESLTRGRM